MSESEISYQNKDIVSKVFADRFKGKSLSVYGLNVPRVADVLPTNLPDFSANELKIDNLFLLEDGSIAIIDYESKYSKKKLSKDVLNNARRWLKMTDLGQLIEDEKQEAIKKAVDMAVDKISKEKDAQLAKLGAEMAEKDAEIMDLKAQLEALKKA